MTLPLTRPPRGDAGHDGRPRRRQQQARRWQQQARGWRERNRLSQAWATSPRGAAVLLAVCTLFAWGVAVFSTNPPERLWGVMAAGPYGIAAVAARLAGQDAGSPWRSPWRGQ